MTAFGGVETGTLKPKLAPSAGGMGLTPVLWATANDDGDHHARSGRVGRSLGEQHARDDGNGSERPEAGDPRNRRIVVSPMAWASPVSNMRLPMASPPPNRRTVPQSMRLAWLQVIAVVAQEQQRQTPVELGGVHRFSQDEATDEEKDDRVSVRSQQLRGGSDAEDDGENRREQRGHRHRQRFGDLVHDCPREQREQCGCLGAEAGSGRREDEEEQQRTEDQADAAPDARLARRDLIADDHSPLSDGFQWPRLPSISHTPGPPDARRISHRPVHAVSQLPIARVSRGSIQRQW